MSDINRTQPKLVLGNCLLHGDYHLMRSGCWNTVVEFWMKWHVDVKDVSDQEIKVRYDSEVERKMLDNLIEELNPEETASV